MTPVFRFRPMADVRIDAASLPSFGRKDWRVRYRPPGRRPGHAFSGPRSRGTGCGSQAPAHQHRLDVPAGWRPRMGPAPACPGHLPCHHLGLPAGTPHRVDAGRWRRLRAQAPFAVATGPACRAGVDATGAPSAAVVDREVGRRTQVPPPPCRNGGPSPHGGQRMTATGQERAAHCLLTECSRACGMTFSPDPPASAAARPHCRRAPARHAAFSRGPGSCRAPAPPAASAASR